MKVLRLFVEGAVFGQIPLPEGTFTLGSASDNGVVVQRRGVSRRHAEIRREGDALSIRDLGSTNGVIVNGRQVRETEFRPGDEVLLGTVVLKVEEVDASAADRLASGTDHLYRACLREFLGALACDAGYLLTRVEGRFAVVAQEGSLDRAVLSETLLDRAAGEGRPLVIDEPSEHPSLMGVDSLMALTGPWSIHYIPLCCGENVIGMVCLSRRAKAPDLPAETRRQADSLARLAGQLLHLDQVAGVMAADQLRIVRARLDSEERLLREMGDPDLLGRSRALGEVLDQVRRVAPSGFPVLFLGETGTGKELLARRLHQLSGRAAGPFVKVNCAAIPDDLVESELFGHERGSFTGATARQVGKFVKADRGTIFLDEVGDLSPRAQAKLLRALDSGEVEPVGAGGPVTVSVRVVAATNKDLGEEIRRGTFREDLYFRLEKMIIRVPALRERPGDIGLLAAAFAQRAGVEFGRQIEGLSVAAIKALGAHAWPGNVRELQNVMARAALRAEGPAIDLADLPPEISGLAGVRPALTPASLATLDWRSGSRAFERAYFRALLEVCGGNVSEVARRAGLARRHLYARLRGLDLAAGRASRGSREPAARKRSAVKPRPAR